MRILFLHRQPCIRTLKYATALRAARPDIALGFAYQGLTLTGWYGSGDELFERWWRLPARAPHAALSRAIAAFRPDVIHSHNLPDLLTVVALEVADGRVPVIHDSHDMQSLRQTPYEDGFDDPEDPDELERLAVEGCAGLVAVSSQMLDALRARHTVPPCTMLFPNLALERDVVAVPRGSARGDGPLRVVYQGSLSENGSHYDLREAFRALGAAGLAVDVYPNRPAPGYADLGPRVRLLPTRSPRAITRLLPDYDAGWAAFNDGLNGAHLDTALPNKAFEYLAAGIPVVAGHHAALRDLVTEHGVGIVVPPGGDPARAILDADLPALRERAVRMRRDVTVEAQIGRLLELYEEVAAAVAA